MDETIIRTGRDGKLHGRIWHSNFSSSDRAIIVVHGLGDHSGRYAELASDLTARGWNVVAYDQLGHGKSPGRRGCVDSYDGMLRDLAQVRRDVASRLPDAKQFLLGHSMGGNVAINYTLRRSEFAAAELDLCGLVLCAPVLLPPDSPPRPKVFAAWITGYLLRWLSIRKPVSGKQLSRDTDRVALIKQDPLMHSRISIYLGTQILAQGRWALDHARELDVPTLVMYGDNDTLIDRAACEHIVMRIGEPATCIAWPEMCHDLFHDFGREEVMAALGQWLEGHCEV